MEPDFTSINGGAHAGDHHGDNGPPPVEGSVLMVSQCADNIDHSDANDGSQNDSEEKNTGNDDERGTVANAADNDTGKKGKEFKDDRKTESTNQTLAVPGGETGMGKVWYTSTGHLATVVENGAPPELVIGFDGFKVDPESKHK